MNIPVITICIAIYNRLAPFKYTFERLLNQLNEIEDNFYEVVVSVNPDESGDLIVPDYATMMAKQNNFRLFINEKNIGGEANIINAVKNAKGKYVWIIGDDDLVLCGTLNKIREIVINHPDLTWLFMNTARVNGKIEDENAKLLQPKVTTIESGYYSDGINCMINTHKLVDASLLFSSSNIYLRDSMMRIWEKQDDKSDCNQLASAFDSASRGAAFLIDESCVLAGGVTTWSDRKDYFLGFHYNKDILCAIGNGLSKKQAVDLIAYRMRHDAIRSWFVIFKMMLKRNKMGLEAYKSLLELIPLETSLITLFFPVVALYLYIRHHKRNCDRLLKNRLYLNDPSGKIEIKNRIRLN